MVLYISTRGGCAPKTFKDVLLDGLAPDGGLYVPMAWPQVNVADFSGLSYADVAYRVIKPFVGDDIPDDDLQSIVANVYGRAFSHAAVAPLVQMGPSSWVLELFHGPTLAFKDYALQLLGALFDYVLAREDRRVTIVGATSGDTGSAAIEACRASKHIDIFILHPHGRTSDVQRRQMTTVLSPNVHNIALDGTFDDCQAAVKALFADEAFRNRHALSAVNSINWARIMAQIVYYMTACAALSDGGRKISFAVPTGNFGNIYAAYAAKQMGAPIDRLVIGSNRNDILTRFFETGEMKEVTVEPSLSPSMDIQVSSNFERFLLDVCDRDAEQVKRWMSDFKNDHVYALSAPLMERARAVFESYSCDDAQTSAMMAECYERTGYLADPHTAVGLYAAWCSQNKNNLSCASPLVSLACAHPAKFPVAVETATGVYPNLPAHMADLYEREERFEVLPNDLETLKSYIKERV